MIPRSGQGLTQPHRSINPTQMSHSVPQPLGQRISQWGEGPLWWEGALLYVDIEGHTLIKLDTDTGDEQTWDVGERIGTVVPTSDENYLYAGDSGIVRFNPNTGEKIAIADPEATMRETNRFNDGKCDPAGRFWAGSISLTKNTGSANLYCLDTDGSLSLKIPAVTNSNGICWTGDAKALYYIDTPTKQIRAYDYDMATGVITNARVAINTEELGFDSSPDGMTIDTEDKVWVAFCHGGCVARFDPTTGKLLQRIDLPCLETTACAFGGPNLDRLFVTTGIHKTIEEPEAGKIFVIDGLGVQGVPAFAYTQSK